jgi:hypothetical protein
MWDLNPNLKSFGEVPVSGNMLGLVTIFCLVFALGMLKEEHTEGKKS